MKSFISPILTALGGNNGIIKASNLRLLTTANIYVI